MTREPTHHFKMLLKSTLLHVCLCTCESVTHPWIDFGFENPLVQLPLFTVGIIEIQKQQWQ